jgi:hypothetical protein
MAHLLGLRLPSKGKLTGRVLNEALKNGPDKILFQTKKIASEPSVGGKSTILLYQQVGRQLYFDEASYVDPRGTGQNPCR